MKLDVNKIITESLEEVAITEQAEGDEVQAKLYQPKLGVPEPLPPKQPLTLMKDNADRISRIRALARQVSGKKKEIAARSKELKEVTRKHAADAEKHAAEMGETTRKHSATVGELTKKSAEEIGKREGQIKAEKGVSTGLRGELTKVQKRPGTEDLKTGTGKIWGEVKNTAKDIKNAVVSKSLPNVKQAVGKHFTLDINKMEKGNTTLLGAGALAAGLGALALRKRMKKSTKGDK